MEMYYGLNDKFKKKGNSKTHGSSLNFKTINLGNEEKPQLINLGINCSLEEEKYFVKLCREFRDVFS